MERGSVRLEDITNAANRMDEFLRKRVVQLCSQPADDDIDDICIGVEGHVPNLLDDFAPRNHFAGGTGKVSQEEEFFWSQIQGLSCAHRPLPGNVDLEI